MRAVTHILTTFKKSDVIFWPAAASDYYRLIFEMFQFADDWKYVAMVLDRILLWFFTVACVVGKFNNLTSHLQYVFLDTAQ